MVSLFNNFIYDPIFQLLIFIYQNIGIENLGLSIIGLTILIRVVLFPLFYKSAKAQAMMKKIKPHIDKIREKYKDNKEKQAQKLMSLYKKHNFNPFSGFLILIVQLPIFFALFMIFKDAQVISETFSHTTFLGISLLESSYILTFAVAILQYFQGELTMGKSSNKNSNSPMAKFSGGFKYILPVIAIIVLSNLPSALALYWGTSTLFAVGQQVVINKTVDEDDVDIDNLDEEGDKKDKKENE